MHMSIPEQFLLLTMADSGVGFLNVPADVTSAAFFSAGLMDLALRGKIDRDLDRIWVADPTPVNDESIDILLKEICDLESRGDRNASSHSSIDTINRFVAAGGALRERVLLRLCTRNVLVAEDVAALWRFKWKRYSVVDKRELMRVRSSFQEAVLNEGLPDPRDVCLMSLVNSAGLLRYLVPMVELNRARRRVSDYIRLEFVNKDIFDQIEMLEWSVRALR
jgi:Golgi phosphoprotein 3